ncbi:FTR1 family protein [Peribacillus sp. SCS-155]|uniref:FTR1 family iron permease n=1 Tax=Peribacillus sedimenti TaxID=3115297 RepID=UPI003905818E
MRSKWFSMAGILLLCFILTGYKAEAQESHDDLFVLIGQSLMKVKEGDLSSVSKNMAEFQAEWDSVRIKGDKDAAAVGDALQKLRDALSGEKPDQKEIKGLLSSLSSSLLQYENANQPSDKQKDKDKIASLLPLIDQLEKSFSVQEYEQAKAQYSTLLSSWTEGEKAVRNKSVVSYGDIERNMALFRIALTKEPVDQEQGQSSLISLKTSINEFLAGKEKKSPKTSYTLSDITSLLEKSENSMDKNQYSQASGDLNEILTIWPMVEGDVQTRNSKLYSDVETRIPEAISILESKKPDATEAKSIVTDLRDRLTPLSVSTSYSVWDAMLILLREGLEALLIVATFIAFLRKVNHGDKQKWIWAGVAAGLAFSAMLAVGIKLVFSQLTAASSREYIEGITGIIAVIMMLTVGAWLHGKSSIQSWNRYINKQMGNAIAKGSLLSFAFISFLSISREGAETIIFYTGMAPYMSLQKLASGIAVALVILVIIGFLIIRYSVRIPISLFFSVATVLIYLISFKILGVSVHSLQVSKVIETHTISAFPFIDLIGLYPTWETLIPQLALLVVILSLTYWIKGKNKEQAVPHNKPVME